jgi:hypothetical protein
MFSYTTQTGAELILASRNLLTGDIMWTFKQTFPRIILAEINTHKIAVKNTSSSRAIPTMDSLKRVIEDPFLPASIGEYQRGMQAGEEIEGWRRRTNEAIWLLARYPASFAAWMSYKLGAPKQFSNRLIEPWGWTEQIWSSTDIENEMRLRNHRMAEPHYELLAADKVQLIAKVRAHFGGQRNPSLAHLTQDIGVGQWHMPFVTHSDFNTLLDDAKRKNLVEFVDAGLRYLDPVTHEHTIIEGAKDDLDASKIVSAGRCAWVSYTMPGKDSKKMNTVTAAMRTYHKLTGDAISHLSPLEHVATPLPFSLRVGPTVGFMQFRKELPNEAGGDKVVLSITAAMAKELLAASSTGADTVTMLQGLQEMIRISILEQQALLHGPLPTLLS